MLGLALVLLAAVSGCSGLVGCRFSYDPQAAKATFDGRVGAVEIQNDSSVPVRVELFHPDGTGEVEVTTTADPGLTRIDGGFGNDWGIRIAGGCIETLGQAGDWSGEAFVIAWLGD